MQIMKRIISAFLLIITLICNCPCNVYASSNLSGWDNWTVSEKASYFFTVVTDVFSGALGFVVSQGSNTQDVLLSYLRACYDDLQNESQTYEDWLASRLDVQQNTETGEPELVIDNELMDLMYNASVQYIEEETPWENMYTTSVTEFYNLFKTKQAYDKFCEVAKSLKSNEIILLERAFDSVWHADEAYYEYFYHYRVVNFDGLVKYRKLDTKLSSVIPYYQWKYSYNLSDVMSIDDNGNIDTYLNSKGSAYNNDSSYYYIKNYNFVQTFSGSSNTSYWLVENISHCHRVYDSVETYKQYSLGQRPYYVTDAFSNYNSTIDNSTTITQTEIDNSVTYGDVYNYITNNYENPDGLSEDELRAILAEYLASINNNGGSGSGGGSGGSDNGGSSGGGLGSFLGGLGSIGDAILSILGKLLEYIGKALELLTGTVTKVLDLIPSNITNLLLGLFPFIPQEWVTAIELSLVLGVVLAVVGAFKK